MAITDRLGATVDATEAPSSSTPNAGLAIKTAVRAATTGSNIVLSGLQAIDGIALNAGDRVLVKDQVDQTTNGIYNVSTGNWAASSDFQSNTQLAYGCLIYVLSGTVNSGSVWALNVTTEIILGSTALIFILVLSGLGGANIQFPLIAGRNSLSIQSTLTASVSLGGTNFTYTPPSPNNYLLFPASAVDFNSGSLWANLSNGSNIGAAFVPPAGAKAIEFDAQIYVTGGAATINGSFVAKWCKNATVASTMPNASFQQPYTGAGADVRAGIGFAGPVANFAVIQARCKDKPNPGDYYNLFVEVDSTDNGVATVTIDGNPAHTYAQASVFF